MRLCSALVCAAVLLSSPALAQDGLRSASLPERPRKTSLSTRVDQFRASPDAFQVRPLPQPTGGSTMFPGFFFPSAPPVVIVIERVVERAPAESRRETPAVTPAPPAERVAPAPAPVLPPAPPKTFYVIPGCYAGDKRPEPEQLPAGCEMSRLRVIPPQR